MICSSMVINFISIGGESIRRDTKMTNNIFNNSELIENNMFFDGDKIYTKE